MYIQEKEGEIFRQKQQKFRRRKKGTVVEMMTFKVDQSENFRLISAQSTIFERQVIQAMRVFPL